MEMESGKGSGKRKRKWSSSLRMNVTLMTIVHKESERVKHAALSTASPNSCNEINSC